MWVPEMGFVYSIFIIRCIIFAAMRKILTFAVVALIAAAASIAGLNVAQAVYAASGTTGTCPCGSGNPHVADPDTGIVPQGNPHDFESGLNNGNPHTKG